MTEPLVRMDENQVYSRFFYLQSLQYPVPVVSKVTLRNFKSISSCSVELDALTVLVGANGSGKSNFVDGLRLTSDALNTNLENALRERGGLVEVRRRSRGHPTHFAVKVELQLGQGFFAEYAYQVGAGTGGVLQVKREICSVNYRREKLASLSVDDGRVTSSVDYLNGQIVNTDSLALSVFGATIQFGPVVRALQNIGFYSLNPDRVRELQNPDVGELLSRDGNNLAAVVRATGSQSPETLNRITKYLSAIVPGIQDVTSTAFGPKETLMVRQEVKGDPNPWKFYASSLSDGTLRALGVLVAAFQRGARDRISMVAIEEPEVAIHPGAGMRLMDALIEASQSRQILVTTHSPDLLDHPNLDVSALRAVASVSGETIIGAVDPLTRSAIHHHLFTPGELLRQEQIEPDFAALAVRRQERLF